jgi:hypothetical protein
MILLIYNKVLDTMSCNSILKIFRDISKYRNDIIIYKIFLKNDVDKNVFDIINIIKNNDIKLIFCVWSYLTNNIQKDISSSTPQTYNIIQNLENLNLNVKILCHVHDFFYKLKQYDNLIKTHRYIEIGFEDQIKKYTSSKNTIYPLIHCATNNFIKEFNKNPINKIFLSGGISKLYPERKEFYNYAIKNNSKIFIKARPMYFEKDDNYANELHSYIACFYSSINELNNTILLAKAFEIPATGSLLLAHKSCKDSLMKVGFKENINCLFIENNTYDQVINYILDPNNRGKIDEIRMNGQKLVLENHTESIRIKKINEYLDKIIQEPN